MDDNTLCHRLAADLDGAFESLVRGHQDRLYSVALRIVGDPADAEEIAQDAFVRAYRALASYEAGRIRELHLRAWLATIAINLARNRRRRISDRQPALPISTVEATPAEPRQDREAGPEAVHGRRAVRERWAGLLATLPERYRIPIVLRHVDDLSYSEMAEVLERPEGTLKAQVHRGLALLRVAAEHIEREELSA
jgi:RNA polymerase sigma-70 factor (ECF subfamily)